jgi:hypothetical protein
VAINRAPFNALIDDNGTGLTGSVWNKAAIQGVILDPVDAAFGTTRQAWVPVDTSGANLPLSNGGCYFAKVGCVVFFWGYVAYPANADANQAKIGNLPFAASTTAGGFAVYGVPTMYHISNGSAALLLFNGTTGAPVTNQGVSGATLIFQGSYPTAAP